MRELLAKLIKILKKSWKYIKEMVKKIFKVTKSWFKSFINEMFQEKRVKKILCVLGKELKDIATTAVESTLNEFFDDTIIAVGMDDNNIDEDNIVVVQSDDGIEENVKDGLTKPVILTC